jgi:hypothetical protein
LTTLRGYEISPPRIRDAESRIANKPGRKLHYLPTPRRTEPISERAKNDDGTAFFRDGLRKLPDGSWGKTPADYREEARKAAEKANPPQAQTPILDASEAAWKQMADGLLQDGTHSQQQRMRAVYDNEQAQGSSWRRIYEVCKRETNLYKNRSIR